MRRPGSFLTNAARTFRSRRCTSRPAISPPPRFRDRSGWQLAGVPHRHPAPRVELHVRGSFAVLVARRLPGARNDVGRKDGVAETVARPLGQAHPAVQRARTRSVRLAAAGPRLLERADAQRRRRALSRNRHVAVPTRLTRSMPLSEELADRARNVLERNRRGSWTCPSSRLYPHQWLWDSCFIAIGLARY